MFPVNWWLVFPVALIPLIVGFLWYSPATFHNVWLKSANLTQEELAQGNMGKIFGLAYLYSILVALLLPMIVIHQFGLSGMFGMMDDWMVAGSELMNSLDALDAQTGMYTRHLHFGHGAMHGGFFALFFVGPIFWINALFERRNWKYMLLHTGYWVVCLALMGGVEAQFMVLPL